MKAIQGSGVCAAIAIGEIIRLRRSTAAYRGAAEGYEAERSRFHEARDQVDRALAEEVETAKRDIGENEAQIFEIHRMMLYDDDFGDLVEERLTDGLTAETAVTEAAEQLAAVFAGMDGEYMQGRAADVRDIARRIVNKLSGGGELTLPDHPVIIAADDLTPGETVKLDRRFVLGFVTECGSENSHTAILARTLNIPAVVGVGALPDDISGRTAILDGANGVMYLDPDEKALADYAHRMEAEDERRMALEKYRGMKSITADGRRIRVYANVGAVEDVADAKKWDAEGIGLFRSEFLYMKYGRAPTEEEQFSAYKAAAEQMPESEVIIRTLDAGADKKLDFLGLPPEENPALGVRAIRLCLEKEDLFRTQLRALYRASVYGNISIMLPMIVSPDEVERARAVISSVKAELTAEGIEYQDDVPLGVMIETPAAAICADHLAAVADFFSIGTNDLLQYTMAADRQNSGVSHLTAGAPEAVMRLIRRTAEAADKEGIWVGICGEMAADTSLIPQFIKWGVTELSVAPPHILAVRSAVAKSSFAELQH